MEEKTADEIAAIFSAAGDSVTLINTDANFAAYQSANPSDILTTESEWKDMIKRNYEHLEIIKAYKKLDETSIYLDIRRFYSYRCCYYIRKNKSFLNI